MAGDRTGVTHTSNLLSRPAPVLHDVESLILAPALTASLFLFFRRMAVTGAGSRISGSKCVRSLRSHAALQRGMSFSCHLSPNVWLTGLGKRSRAVLDPRDPPFRCLALMLPMALSSGSIVILPRVIIFALQANAKNMVQCRGLVNSTSVRSGSRHLESLNPRHLP